MSFLARPDMIQEKWGLLLCNLGTPNSASVKDVRQYLNQFLMDPYVIDIPTPLRFLLVKGIILPTRPKKSAEAYKKIWTSNGSPLLTISLEQKQKVQEELKNQGLNWVVELGMRYGNPSLEAALRSLTKQGVTKIIFLPLYPQYALSSSVTAQKEFYHQLKKLTSSAAVIDGTHMPFHSHPDFISAWSEVIKEQLDLKAFDHILFSYHGLPERHILKTQGDLSHCLNSQCCNELNESNRFCYRAHCYSTTRLIAHQLNLPSREYSISFQSRLGRTPWIQPFTDLVIPELAQKGIKKLAVVCPSFVTDCLETLEEIEIRARDLFIQSGGNEFKSVSCLNTHPKWIQAMIKIAKDLQMSAQELQ